MGAELAKTTRRVAGSCLMVVLAVQEVTRSVI